MKYLFPIVLMLTLFIFGCVSNKYSVEKATYSAVQEIQIKTNVNNTIAVISASSTKENLDIQIITWLENNLINTGKFIIVSRQRINSIIDELNFGLTGYISDVSAQSLGKMLGANYILVFDIKSVNNMSYLNIQLLETATATLVYSNSFRINITETKIKTEKQKALRF
jgi:PBP1b-binding outer membrane lipoprotein LpoB